MEALELTRKQVQALGFLWFKYGNGGNCHTRDNHLLLQAMIEGRMEDVRLLEHRISQACRDAILRVRQNDYREFNEGTRQTLNAVEHGVL